MTPVQPAVSGNRFGSRRDPVGVEARVIAADLSTAEGRTAVEQGTSNLDVSC